MATQRALTEFADQLEKLINYFSIEFDMTISEVLGVMEVAKFNVLNHVACDDSDDDDEGDEECEDSIND
jgi:hypothetical protein